MQRGDAPYILHQYGVTSCVQNLLCSVFAEPARMSLFPAECISSEIADPATDV